MTPEFTAPLTVWEHDGRVGLSDKFGWVCELVLGQRRPVPPNAVNYLPNVSDRLALANRIAEALNHG